MTIRRRQVPFLPKAFNHAVWLGLGLSIFGGFGCSSDDAAPGGGGSSNGGTAGQANLSGAGAIGGSTLPQEVLGTFRVEVKVDEDEPTSGSTTVLGKVNDGATPLPIIWEEAGREGNCRLEKPRVPFCAPACGADVCVEDGVCRAYPQGLSVGAVTLSGVMTSVGGASLTLKEVAKAYQPPAGTVFAYPPFQAGDTVRLSAAGAELPAFALETSAVDPISLTAASLTLEAGQPLELTWSKAEDPQASRIHVKLDISHHGGSKGMIECDQNDTGSLSIPAALLTELVGLGVAGFPTVLVTRYASSLTTVGSGEVALVVSSTTERGVSIPGVDSCTSDEDCPSGETCQADLTCQ